MAVSACGGGEGDGAGDAAEPSAGQEQGREQGQEQAAPEPDTEDVPDVVAEVNGEEIAKDEFVEAYELQFQQMAAQAQGSGEDVDQDQLKDQVLQSMITTELLVQEADRQEFSASDREVDRTLQQLAEQSGMESVDAFMAYLGEQGMDREEVETQVRTQVRVDKLVAAEAGDVEPTQKELRELYDQVVAQQEAAGSQGGEKQEVPPFAQVRPQLEEQIRSQKQSQAAQALVGDLRERADIEVHL